MYARVLTQVCVHVRAAMPKSLTFGAGRVFLAGWSMFVLILTTCYTSKLTSLLVDVTSPAPFKSVAEMVTQLNFRWGMIGGTKLYGILRVRLPGFFLETSDFGVFVCLFCLDIVIFIYSLSLSLSVCLSVRPSVCLSFLPPPPPPSLSLFL